ncbi:MAG: metalloregulator ArsR/SmtB family transcription factor [Nitriliruptoraceae bacterium]
MTDIYKAIADATRRAILDELVDRDGQTLFELCARLAMRHGIASSRQAISQHLDVLADAGLVHTRRVGRTKVHYRDIRPLEEIVTRWPADSPTETPDDAAGQGTEEQP